MKRTTISLRAIAYATIAVALISLSGCDTCHGVSGQVGILVDASDSTSGMWRSYREDMHQLIDALPVRERVFADRISCNSAAFSDPRKLFLGKLNGDPTPLRDRAEAKKARQDLSSWADQIFDSAKIVGKKPPARGQQSFDGTDILMALKNIEPFFKGGPAGTPKVLALFSDMVEQSPTLDLTDGTLSDKEIESTLNRLQGQGLVPHLEGVEVWLVGINADTSNSLTATRLAKIRMFWLAFFRRAGATSNEVHWTARLMLDGSEWPSS